MSTVIVLSNGSIYYTLWNPAQIARVIQSKRGLERVPLDHENTANPDPAYVAYVNPAHIVQVSCKDE